MPPLPSLIRPKSRQDLLAGPISAFESETQAIFVRTTPYSEHAILHVIVGMIVLSLVLMSVVNLDRVVTATGQLVPTRGTLFVQPLDRAIVKQIAVHTGDVVKKGQVLAYLDPTFAEADVNQFQVHLAAAAAAVARLEAELAGRPYKGGTTPPEMLQTSIWHQRQSEYQQMVADYDARIHSTEAAITKAQQDVAQYSKRLGYARKNEDMELELFHNGNGSQLKVLQAQDTRAETERLLNESQNTLNGSRHDLDSLKAQREQAIGKWQDDTGTQLVTARDDFSQTQQSLAKANKTNELITLTAPEDSVVLDIGNASVGTVIDANSAVMKPLFTLMPIDGPIEAEVQVESQDIGFIKVGDPVRVKLDAYPFMRHGTAEGHVTTISEGSFTHRHAGVDPERRGRPADPRRISRRESASIRHRCAIFRAISG